MNKLDQIDLAILDTLQKDGRTTNVALARLVGLSPTPCLERVKALEAAGIITGYAAALSTEKLGLGLTVFIEITMERSSEDAFRAFRDAVRTIPEIQECHMVAGGFDYLLKVRTGDIARYRAVMGERLSTLPFVASTSTYVAMEAVKDLL